MKLKRCYIENFGKLHEFHYEFEDGICRIEEKNGWGKSTLAAFLGAMFYGMPRTRKQQLSQNDRLRYKPWQGGNYGGNLEFEAGGKTYRITRFFEEKADRFSCIDIATGLETDRFSENIGEELFFIDRESFYRTVYLAADQTQIILTDSINTKLADVENEDTADYENAVAILEKNRRELKKTGKRGKIDLLELEIAECRQQVRMLESKEEEQKALEEKRMQLEQNKLECKKQMEQALYGQSKESHKQEVIRKKLLAVGIEEPEIHKRRGGLFLIGILVIVIAAMLSVRLSSSMIATVGTVAGVLLIVCTLGQTSREERRHEELRRRKQQQFEQLKCELQKIEIEKESVADITALQEQASRTERELDDVRRQLEALEERQIEKVALEEEIARKQQELFQMKERCEMITLTMQFLKQAKENFTSNYLHKLQQAFQDNLQKLGVEDGWRYQIDVDLNVTYEAYGDRKESGYLSSGFQKCVQIALQLAMADALFENEKPFLIVDDTMHELDREHAEMAKKTLAEYGVFYQIISIHC